MRNNDLESLTGLLTETFGNAIHGYSSADGENTIYTSRALNQDELDQLKTQARSLYPNLILQVTDIGDIKPL